MVAKKYIAIHTRIKGKFGVLVGKIATTPANANAYYSKLY